MPTDRDDILRKVQALLAKAMSTPYEAEADTFRSKAAEMMDKYRLEQWELAKAAEGTSVSSLKPVRKDIAINWWYTEGLTFREALWLVFQACAEHCAVVLSLKVYRADETTMPAYGLESDIAFLQMLFTDIFTQMADKIKPKYDPERSLGENVYRAKEAGMKYGQIAHWAGHPEWITIKGYGKNGSPQYAYDGIMIRSMKKYAKEHGLEIHKVINLDAYVQDFCASFSWAIRTKLHEMRTGESSASDSMSLAIRDITDLSKEMMYGDYPDMRPHPDDCDCDRCHFCWDPACKRKRCVDARKPVKHRWAKQHYRAPVYAAQARGAQAGAAARIMSRDEGLGNQKEIK